MKKCITLLALISIMSSAFSQGSDLYGSGLKIKFNDDGSKYLRVITWAQIWTRYNVNNEGSTRNGVPQAATFDIGVRRARMLFLSQISPKFLILAHFGINNENSLSNSNQNSAGNGWKPGLFFHDIWTEYNIVKGKSEKGMEYELSLGAGLHYWNGISRSTNASTLNFMAMDAPIVNWPTIDAADQFARMLGIYAKGRISGFHYRMAVNSPFSKQAYIVNPSSAGKTGYYKNNNSANLQGYFEYQIFDQESDLLPFKVGTYLGSKKVLNVGVGFEEGFDAMMSYNSLTDSSVQNMRHLGVDVFLDLPLSEKKNAITAYAAYYNYNFGKNYVRNIGIMNVADGTLPLQGSQTKSGAGNSYPTIGTGQAIHVQAGYLFGKPEKSSLRIQPYGNVTFQNWEGVVNPSGGQVGWFANGNVGCNWFLEGHHSKITTDIGLRPDFNDPAGAKTRPCFTIQTMIYL